MTGFLNVFICVKDHGYCVSVLIDCVPLATLIRGIEEKLKTFSTMDNHFSKMLRNTGFACCFMNSFIELKTEFIKKKSMELSVEL